MTDSELLGLAATAAIAAGMNLTQHHGIWYDSDYDTAWVPLGDDGDALRLAVKLCMNVEVTDGFVFACSIGNFSEPAKPDREAAVRRAIVRAAAAMASNGETV